jgi:subtilisin family serine protease
LTALLVLASALCGGAAHAQLLPAPLPALPPVTETVDRTLGDPRLQDALDPVRQVRVRALLRTERRRLDVDVRGEPVLRGEFLAIAPDEATLAAVRAAGFVVASRSAESRELGLELVVLRDTRRRSARAAMRALEKAAPQAAFAYQHLYLAAGAATAAIAPATDAPTLRVGLVDGGVDAAHPALAGLRVHRHGCGSGAKATPNTHGTGVAVRLAGNARGDLFVADLWCGDTVGRATLGLVEALAWFARERVAVVNISLVGPDNPVLARAVAALVARGHVLVAAVGNDGPAAPPLYPAAYPGVIGVSGVDAKLRALPEAASGPHVDFSAAGIAGEGARAPRGTSFAAPVVARMAAGLVRTPDAGAAARVQQALAARARDLGKPGRDPRYGDGFVGSP